MHKISPSAAIGKEVILDVDRLTVGENAVIGDGTVITGDELVIDDNACIGSAVRMNADRISVGRRARIENACVLTGSGGRAKTITLGDGFFLGESSKVILPVFIAGDYVSIHNHLLANGLAPCVMGHNTWVGQNCVLNSNDELTIGNNVGIGAYSSIYTHGFFGELLEGCEIFKVAPVTIEDDSWLVGAYNVVSPGVTIGRRSVVLSSSVISRDVAPEECVAGGPAKTLTGRLPAYRPVTLDDKLAMMARFVEEYATAKYQACRSTEHGFLLDCKDGQTRIIEVRSALKPEDYGSGHEGVVYVGANPTGAHPQGLTVFDLGQKTYRKRRTDFEADVISFMNSYRARFVPEENPRVAAR